MSDKSEKSINKRHFEDETEFKQKQQKCDEHEENSINAVEEVKPEPTTITNIYYDCLERIFDFLDIESLLNIAGTCKRLQIAAIAKFGDEYGKKLISLSNYIPNELAVLNSQMIQVNGLRFCLPFLRCFGAKISNLRASFSRVKDETNDYLDRYINQYCADTLTIITYFNKRVFTVENFSKSFQNVTEIRMIDVKLGKHFSNFVNWFPNLRVLRMRQVIIYRIASAVSFPHLEYLTVKVRGNNNNRKKDFTLANVERFLHVKLQLQSLTIVTDTETTLDELLNAISENKSILILKMYAKVRSVTTIDLERLVSEHPLIKELDFRGYQFTVDDAIMLTKQLNSLEQFQFELSDRSEYDRLFNQLDERWKNNGSADGNQFGIKLNR